jgi:Mandelate racemase / muconate lactonizing enzyme, N-terminal domain
VVVEVVTDEGVTGWGESLCHGLQPPEVAASFVEFCYKPMLVGRDPFDAEVLWEELYNRTRPFGGGAAVNALSGVDIALWDAVGRSLSLPSTSCSEEGSAPRSPRTRQGSIVGWRSTPPRPAFARRSGTSPRVSGPYSSRWASG